MSHIYRLAPLFSLMWTVLLTACSEWDTHTMGSKFVPANSEVRKFTHPLYIEYSADGAKVWGPAADEVTADVDGHCVSIHNLSDSLAIFAYGYADKYTDNGNLSIQSSQPYALYLTDLSLRSQSSPVITSDHACHIVLSPNSKNQLFGQINIQGDLTLSGNKGELIIENDATCISAASLSCQYSVVVTLKSKNGNGICLYDGAMRSTGTWNFQTAQPAIASPDSIVLREGNYQGTTTSGAFFSSSRGLLHQMTNILVAAQDCSLLADTAIMNHLESVMPLCQQQLVGVTLEADSSYNVLINSSTTALTKFTPSQTLKDPWVIYTNAFISASDTLHFIK